MDPLALLREYTIKHLPIGDQGDSLIFGEWKALKNVPTSCRSLDSGTFYTLESIWLFVSKLMRDESAVARAAYVLDAKVRF